MIVIIVGTYLFFLLFLCSKSTIFGRLFFSLLLDGGGSLGENGEGGFWYTRGKIKKRVRTMTAIRNRNSLTNRKNNIKNV